MSGIKYLIIYKDKSNSGSTDYQEIAFEKFFDDTTEKAATEFKTALKELLENQKDQEKIKKFIEQLIIVAEKNSTKKITTDNEPFIFAIDNTNSDRVQRTYLTFSGNYNNDLSVNFNQYSVDEKIKKSTENSFNKYLISDLLYVYNYYKNAIVINKM